MQVLLQLQQTTESVAGKRTLTSGPDAEKAAATCVLCGSAKAAEQLVPPKPEMASARTGTKDSTPQFTTYDLWTTPGSNPHYVHPIPKTVPHYSRSSGHIDPRNIRYYHQLLMPPPPLRTLPDSLTPEVCPPGPPYPSDLTEGRLLSCPSSRY